MSPNVNNKQPSADEVKTSFEIEAELLKITSPFRHSPNTILHQKNIYARVDTFELYEN